MSSVHYSGLKRRADEHHYSSRLDAFHGWEAFHLICEPARCLGRSWRAFSDDISHRAGVGLASLYVHRTAVGVYQKRNVD